MICPRCESANTRQEKMIFMCGVFSKDYFDHEERQSSAEEERDDGEAEDGPFMGETEDEEDDDEIDSKDPERFSIEAQAEVLVRICRNCGWIFIVKDSYRETRPILEEILNGFADSYRNDPDLLPPDLRRLIIEE